MKLEELFRDISVIEKENWKPNVGISRITSDSRMVGPGTLFVACKGTRMDAHDFIGQAIQAGASAVVCETLPETHHSATVPIIRVKSSRNSLSLLLQKYHHLSDGRLRVVGVTGTNGKTTIAYLLYHLLRQKTKAAYIGTLNYQWADHHIESSNTTPGPEILIPMLAQMRHEGVQYCIMEVSSHALDQGRVHHLPFDLVIFTQLTQDHFDYHGTMERYFQAKRQLFAREPEPKNMLINQDCEYGRRLLKEFPEAKSYGSGFDADYSAQSVNTDFSGSQFVFAARGQDPFAVKMSLSFKHNVMNSLTVLAGLSLLGFNPRDFLEDLSRFSGVPGRLERVSHGEPFAVFVDYAHTPDAFENVLGQAAKLKPKRILTLFGCGGDRDFGKRKLMTQAACRYSDMVVLTADNPRSEDPEKILAHMREGISASSANECQVFEILDRRQAIEKLISLAEEGDVLFILGKGHEDYQILGDKKVPFDDRQVARDCLQRKNRVLS